MKVAILGAAGRMGHMLCDLVDRSEELELVAKCDVREDYPRTWPAGTEAVIDFTFHEAVPANITKAAEEGVVYVLGTTGLTDEEQKSVEAAAKKIPVVQSGNYSLGVNLLLGLVKKAAEVNMTAKWSKHIIATRRTLLPELRSCSRRPQLRVATRISTMCPYSDARGWLGNVRRERLPFMQSAAAA